MTAPALRPDLLYHLEDAVRSFSIAPKAGGIIPLVPNNCQARIIHEVEKAAEEERPARLIILKARQTGSSTVSEAILLAHAILLEAYTGVVAAHDIKSTTKLFGYTRTMYDTFPHRGQLPTAYKSQNRLTFKKNQSGIYVITASRVTAGRGWAITGLHASELAFYANPETSWLALRQSVADLPGSLIIVESTANGLGTLYEQLWREASQHRNEYVPLFFSWFSHHEYLPCGGWSCHDGTCSTCRAAGNEVKVQDEDERELVKMGVTPPQLAWRRYAITNKCFGNVDLFRQEYPSTSEEAFLSVGVNVFPEPHIRQCFTQSPMLRGHLRADPTRYGGVHLARDDQGPLRVYVRPGNGQEYVIGVDSCYGHGQDLACAQVLNRRTLEQVAVWHGKINPVAFADVVAQLATWYNQALVAPEVFGPGQALTQRLIAIYPNIWTQAYADRMPGHDRSYVSAGWATSWRSKAWLVSHLGNLLERGQLLLHDRPTVEELRVYVYAGTQDSGTFGAAQGHDDTVMALGIACIAGAVEPAMPESSPGRVGVPDAVSGSDGMRMVLGAPEPQEDREWA